MKKIDRNDVLVFGGSLIMTGALAYYAWPLAIAAIGAVLVVAGLMGAMRVE